MDLLLLTTPPQHAAHNPKAQLNPKRLKVWLEQLPVTNVADTVRHLQIALQAMNEIPVAPGERFKLLELYGAFFENSVSYYDQIRIRSLSIKQAQRSALMQDVLWLYLNLANGYKIIVKEFFDSRTDANRDALYFNSIFRAMESLAHAILYARRVGEPVPDLTFLEFKQLFLLAEQHAVHNQPSKVTSCHDNTCALLLKHVCLFSLSDAQATENDDMLGLFTALEPYAMQCRLLAGELKAQRSGRYWLDLLEDSSLTACELVPEPIISPYLRILDIAPALAEIETTLKQPNASTTITLENEHRLLQSFVASARNSGRPHKAAVWPKTGLCALGHDSASFYLQHPGQAAQTATVEVYGGIEVRSLGDADTPISALFDCDIMSTPITDELIVSIAVQVDMPLQLDDLAALVTVRDGQPSVRAALIKNVEAFENGRTRVHISLLPA